MNVDNELERQRVEELLGRARLGQATDAELEELNLYGVAPPQITAARHDGPAPSGDDKWAHRAQADNALIAAGRTKLARTERRIGGVMLVGGWLAALAFPAAGVVSLAGGALLLYSLLRVRLQGQDPYEEIER